MRLLGCLYLLLGALAAVVGLAGPEGTGPMVLAVGVCGLAVGCGLLARRPWAYPAAVTLASVGVAISVMWTLLGSTAAAVSLLVSAAILFYLLTPVGRHARPRRDDSHPRER